MGRRLRSRGVRRKLADALTVSVEQLDALLAEGRPAEEKLSGGEPEAGEPPAVEMFGDRVLSPPWSHRGTVEAAVALRGGGLVKRRVFGWLTGLALTAPAHQWLVHEPGPLVSGLAGRRVSATLVDRLTAMVAELRRMDDVAGGGTVLSLVSHEFDLVTGVLDQATYNEHTARRLHIVLAELGQLAGWAAYDDGDHPLAQRYWITALRAAHSADDRPLGAYVLASMAHQAARQGQPAEAVTLIETAQAGVRGQETASLLALLHSRLAYALASLRDTSACTAAMSTARTHAERLTLDDEAPWLYWMSPATITAGAGNCMLQLDQPSRATELLVQGVTLFGESLPRDRLVYVTRLADALSRPGKQRDLDAAAARGMEAIQLVEILDSTRSVGLIRDLWQQMTPHTKIPAVRDFVARARELVPASA